MPRRLLASALGRDPSGNPISANMCPHCEAKKAAPAEDAGGHFAVPCLPHAAGQKAHRDSDDGKHHHHQDGSGEQLDQL